MKKTLVFITIVSLLLFTSCAGASMGALLGGTLGSAIGGVSGGPRGHDAGLLIGAVGGAMIGAAVENAAENQKERQQVSDQQKYQEEKARLAQQRSQRQTRAADGYEPEDIDFGDEIAAPDAYDAYGSYGTRAADGSVEEQDADDGEPLIQIRNVRFIDADGTNTISRGEQCSIVFEIYNAGDAVAYDIEPSVVETNGNSHIQISPSILIESLAAHKGVKYTARLAADSTLRDGTAYFAITVAEDGVDVGESINFSIPTSKN